MELRIVIGPAGSGKRTRLNILQDLFGFTTVSRVKPKDLTSVIQGMLAIHGSGLQLAVEIPTTTFSAEEDFEREYDTFVEDCIAELKNTRTLFADADMMVIFMYCAQERVEERLSFGFHPLMPALSDLQAAVFTECTISVRLFSRLCEECDKGFFSPTELVFSDRTDMTAEQLKGEISARRYHRHPDEPDISADEKIGDGVGASPLNVPDAVKDIQDTLAPVKASFVTRGWNHMSATVLELAKAKEEIRLDPNFRLNCLLMGESGTGKEGIAKFLHLCGGSSLDNFVPIDCTAVPEHLLESELFGHLKGTFTGADHHRTGLVAGADGGTVFLDEIGLMPLSLQAKLLRFIEDRKYRPLGSNKWETVNCRIVAATSRDLAKEVEEKRFLGDLYNRLKALTITIPALRERREDIFPLLREYAPHVTFKPAARALLFDYRWGGNVRELRQVAERYNIRARALTDGKKLEIGVSTLLEDWPRSVAKNYIEGAMKWRWAMRELTNQSHKRIYYQYLRRRKQAGKLKEDEAFIDQPSSSSPSRSKQIAVDPQVLFRSELERRIRSTDFEGVSDLLKALMKAKAKTGTLDPLYDEALKVAITEVLDDCKGNMQKAAAKLQMNRGTLNKRMKDLNISGADDGASVDVRKLPES